MRWVLPGGAVLGGGDRPVACRPRGAVVQQVRPHGPIVSALPEPSASILLPTAINPVKQGHRERLTTVKLWLEVLAILVGLLGTLLALLGLSNR